MENPKAKKTVFGISERAGKSFWTRIGIALENRDGSWNLKLDAIPINGQMQLRDYQERDERSHEPVDRAGAFGNGGNGRRAHDYEAPLV